MKLLVLGGTGGTGRQVVRQALDAGHQATSFSRQAGGDVADRAALTAAMRGHDAVISAIGRGLTFKPDRLIERSVPVILESMNVAAVRRLVFTSALGVGDTFRDSPLVAKLFFSTLLRGIYADKLIGDELIRKSNVDWTIVQPSQMTDKPLTKQYRSGERLKMSGMPQVSRADVAHFLLACVTDDSTIRKTLVVSN